MGFSYCLFVFVIILEELCFGEREILMEVCGYKMFCVVIILEGLVELMFYFRWF